MRYTCPIMLICDRGLTSYCRHALPHEEIVGSSSSVCHDECGHAAVDLGIKGVSCVLLEDEGA